MLTAEAAADGEATECSNPDSAALVPGQLNSQDVNGQAQRPEGKQPKQLHNDALTITFFVAHCTLFSIAIDINSSMLPASTSIFTLGWS